MCASQANLDAGARRVTGGPLTDPAAETKSILVTLAHDVNHQPLALSAIVIAVRGESAVRQSPNFLLRSELGAASGS